MARTRSSRRVDQVLDIAKMLEKKTRELIPFSANMPAGDEIKKTIPFLFYRKQLKSKTQLLNQLNLDPNIMTGQDEPVFVRNEYQEIIKTTLSNILELICALNSRSKTHRKNGAVKSKLECLENMIKKATRFGVGNCGELTHLLGLLLREYQPEDHIDIQYESLYIKGRGDHALIIINRDPGSDIKDLTSWGEQAIICDPWFRETVIVSHQLKLDKHARANCITYLLTYINEPFDVCPPCMAGSKEPHSSYWYNKYGNHSSALFINRTGTISFSKEFEAIDRQYTTIFNAVIHAHDDIVVKLLAEGVNPNQTCKGITLLSEAIAGQFIPIVRHLIASGADVNLASNGEPPLVQAVMQNNAEIVRILLEAGADINQAAADGSTALLIASYEGYEEMERLLRDVINLSTRSISKA